MTVVYLTTTSKRTPGHMRGIIRKRRKHKELLIGLAVTAAILGGTAAAAFNGGVSLEAGKMQMTLDASFTDGLHLTFLSI
jgi:hypothetical protein